MAITITVTINTITILSLSTWQHLRTPGPSIQRTNVCGKWDTPVSLPIPDCAICSTDITQRGGEP